MRSIRWLAVGMTLLVSLAYHTGKVAPTVARAASPLSLSIALTSDPHLVLDSNKPCVQGPDAAYIEFDVTNSSSSSLSGLTATLQGFTTGFSLAGNDVASRPLGTLIAGQTVPLYYFITYPCTAGGNDTLTLSVTDGNGGTASGTGTVSTYSSISANAGGSMSSSTMGTRLGQNFPVDVTYSFGSVSNGDDFQFNPAGNPSFNAGCFRLVAAQVTASQVDAIPVDGAKIFYVASANQGGTSHTVTVRYWFSPICTGTTTTAFPYAAQTSGNINVKYSGNYGVTVGVPSMTAITATAVTSSLNPSIYGQSVTFTAAVTRTYASGTPGGTVDFVADSGTPNQTILCSGVSLDASGNATCHYAGLAVGSHTITATYNPDSQDQASTGTLTGGQTVTQTSSTTTVNTSLNPAQIGQSVTFTATVSGSTPSTVTQPTGTVSFFADSTLLGTGTLTTSNGSTTTTFSTLSLAVGDHPVTASYAGDSNYSGSSGNLSSSESIYGMPAGTGNANPGSVKQGNTTLLTVNVTPGQNPASSGLSVTVDLSTIGGSSTQTFYDDGTNGDVTAGDGTFSFQATVAAATSLGSKSLPFTVNDAQSRSASGNISLTVADGVGPVTSNLSVSPDPALNPPPLLTGTIDDTTAGNSAIQRAEYFIDTQGNDGAGTAMAASDGTFDSPTEGVTANLDATAFGNLYAGTHTLYVHGEDAAGNWGPFQSITFTKNGPTIAVVKSFTAKRSGTQVAFRWHLVQRSHVAGFNLYAGIHKLNKSLIKVHSKPTYNYHVTWSKHSHFILQVLLTDGQHILVKSQ